MIFCENEYDCRIQGRLNGVKDMSDEGSALCIRSIGLLCTRWGSPPKPLELCQSDKASPPLLLCVTHQSAEEIWEIFSVGTVLHGGVDLLE